MARKETKRKKVSKTVKSIYKGKRKEIIIETIVVVVILGLFVFGVTKIIREEMHGRVRCEHSVKLAPSGINSIVTETAAKKPYNL